MTEPPAEAGPASSEVELLRTELDELRRRLARRETRVSWRRRARRWFVGFLVALFSIGTVASLIGVWAKQTALETDSFVSAVHPLLRNDEVSRALAAFITDELFIELDVDRRAEEALPDNLQFLVGPLDGIVRDYTRDAITDVLRSDQFDRIWDQAVTSSHQLAVQVLRGDTPPGVEERDGEVVLDLVPAIQEILQRIVNQGPGFLGNVELPDLDSDATRGEIRRQLENRFDIDLPADFGQIVVFHEDQLSEAQDAVHVTERFVVVVVFLTFVFGAGALLVSVDRRRTLLQLGLGVAVATYLVFTILRRVADDLVDLIEGDENRAAAHAAAQIVSRGLRDRAWYLLVGGLAVAVGAYLAGPGRGAVWTRRTARSLGRRARAGAGKGAGAFSGTAAGRWVETNVDGLRFGGLIAAFAFLLLFDHTWTTLVVVLLLLAAYEVGLALYLRRETPAPE